MPVHLEQPTVDVGRGIRKFHDELLDDEQVFFAINDQVVDTLLLIGDDDNLLFLYLLVDCVTEVKEKMLHFIKMVGHGGQPPYVVRNFSIS